MSQCDYDYCFWNLSVNILATLLGARADRHMKALLYPCCACAHNIYPTHVVNWNDTSTVHDHNLPFIDIMISLLLTTPVFFPLNSLKYDLTPPDVILTLCTGRASHENRNGLIRSLKEPISTFDTHSTSYWGLWRERHSICTWANKSGHWEVI